MKDFQRMMILMYGVYPRHYIDRYGLDTFSCDRIDVFDNKHLGYALYGVRAARTQQTCLQACRIVGVHLELKQREGLCKM